MKFKIIVAIQLICIVFMGYEIYSNSNSFSNFVKKSELYDSQDNIDRFNRFVSLKQNLERKLEVKKSLNYDFLENNMLNIYDGSIKKFIKRGDQLLLASNSELFLFDINNNKLKLFSSKEVDNIQKILFIDKNLILVVKSNTLLFFKISKNSLKRYKLYEIDSIRDVVYLDGILYVASRKEIQILSNNNGVLSFRDKVDLSRVRKLQIMDDQLFAFLYKGVNIYNISKNLTFQKSILKEHKILDFTVSDSVKYFLVHNGVIRIDENGFETKAFNIFDVLVFEKISIFTVNEEEKKLILVKINHKKEIQKFSLDISNNQIKYDTNNFDIFKYVDEYKIENDIFIKLD